MLIFLRPKDNHVKTFYIKFYCQTLHKNLDIGGSKYVYIFVYFFYPSWNSHSADFFVQINTLIVSQLITMPTKDVTMNVKILIHILPFLKNLVNLFFYNCIIKFIYLKNELTYGFSIGKHFIIFSNHLQ